MRFAAPGRHPFGILAAGRGTAQGRGSDRPVSLLIALVQARAAYANAHGGQLMSDIGPLLPYFRNPADGAKWIEFDVRNHR